MIIDSLLSDIFSSRFLTYACFRLQLYSCYFIILAAYCIIAPFCATLTYGGGGARPVLYNFRGSEVLLYNVIWGGVVKKSTFLCYIIMDDPLPTV